MNRDDLKFVIKVNKKLIDGVKPKTKFSTRLSKFQINDFLKEAFYRTLDKQESEKKDVL